MNEKPLISLCITCYNQVKYIREALQSAFKQTYSPLEIVISDDCSTDGTDKIIGEMITSYKGQHKIVYSRNEKNLYVARNYEKAFKMAHGELLVTGAGDDISLPDRVKRIVDAWLEADCKPSLIQHGWVTIGENGKELWRSEPWDIRTQLGAVTAYRKDVFKTSETFPDDRNIYEDGILSLRALACGDVLSLNAPLICWRISTGESTCGNFRDKRRRIALHQVLSCRYFDMELKRLTDVSMYRNIANSLAVMRWRLRHYSAEYDAVAGRFPWTRLHGLLHMTQDNGWNLSWRDKWLVYGSYVPPFGLRWVFPFFIKICVKFRVMRVARWVRHELFRIFRMRRKNDGIGAA